MVYIYCRGRLSRLVIRLQMHFRAFMSLAAALVLASSALAKITSISTVASVKRGASLRVTLHTQDYITNWSDYSVIWGFRKESVTSCTTCVGTPVASDDLHSQGHYDTGTGHFTEVVPAPTSPGTYNLTAAVTSVFGASEEVAVVFFTTVVRVT